VSGSVDPVVTEGVRGALSSANTSNVAVNADSTSGDEIVSRDGLDKGGAEGHNGEEGREVHGC